MGGFLNGLKSFFSNNGGSMVSQAASMIYNSKEAEKSRNWSSNEAQKARDYQTDMWNKTNMYNSPENQKQLLKDAGLNVNAMYGQGTAGTEASLASANQASGGSAGSSSPMAMMGIAQIQNMESVTNLNNANAEKARKETSWMDEINTTNIEQTHAQIKSIMSTCDVNYAMAGKLSKELDVMQQAINESISRVNINEKTAQLTTEQINHQILENQTYMEGFRNAQNLLKQQARLAGKEADMFEAQTNQINQLLPLVLAGKASENEILELQKAGIKIENGKAQWDLDHMDEKWKQEVKNMKAARFKEYTGAVCGAVNTIIDGVGAVMTGGTSAAAKSMMQTAKQAKSFIDVDFDEYGAGGNPNYNPTQYGW